MLERHTTLCTKRPKQHTHHKTDWVQLCAEINIAAKRKNQIHWHGMAEPSLILLHASTALEIDGRETPQRLVGRFAAETHDKVKIDQN